jgi:hypothetical protein
VEAWAKRYQDQGLVVIGVHTPEFAFEKQEANVRKAISDFGITYPVAMDNDWTIWKAFRNNFWPAHYFIDAQGGVRHEHFGEGDYDRSEQVIRALLTERNGAPVTGGVAKVTASGVQAAADFANSLSPETYLGYAKAERFDSAGGLADNRTKLYQSADRLDVNRWAYAGDWRVQAEQAIATAAHARILFRFHARDLHMVLGPSPHSGPIRFRVTLDGRPPGADHGVDVNAQGEGVVTSQRLYQIIRQGRVNGDRLFEIEFLDPGAQAFTFTFG